MKRLNIRLKSKFMLVFCSLMLLSVATVLTTSVYVFHRYEKELYRDTSLVLNISVDSIEQKLSAVDTASSYVVMGKGNPESFCSSSHGAGRRYSRKGAMAAFSCEEVMVDLKAQSVVLGKKNKADVAEESRFAYKNIEEVMDNQQDLVVPVKRLKTIGVVKG